MKAGGSVENVTMGNFLVDDRELRVIVPGNLSSKSKTLDLKSTSGAFRYRYDFKRDFTASQGHHPTIVNLAQAIYGRSNTRSESTTILWRCIQ